MADTDEFKRTLKRLRRLQNQFINAKQQLEAAQLRHDTIRAELVEVQEQFDRLVGYQPGS